MPKQTPKKAQVRSMHVKKGDTVLVLSGKDKAGSDGHEVNGRLGGSFQKPYVGARGARQLVEHASARERFLPALESFVDRREARRAE